MTDFKTGDLLLFKGNGIFSAIITALPGADYSHVGFYYDHDLFGPCVFESTSLGNDNDIFTGKVISGVQVTKFNDRVAHYNGEVFVRHLKEPLSDVQLKVFSAQMKKWHGTPYEKDNLQLIRAELDIFPWHRNETDESSMFCSELTAHVLQAMGLMPSVLPTNEFTPTDMAHECRTVYRCVEKEPLFTAV